MKELRMNVTYLAPAFVISVVAFFFIEHSPTYNGEELAAAMASNPPHATYISVLGAFLIMWGACAAILHGADLVYERLTRDETDLLTEWEESGE